MAAATTRPLCVLRHFSAISFSASSTANTSSPAPLLTRYLNLWEQKSGTHEILRLKHNVNLSSAEFDAKQHQVSEARTAVDRALQAFEYSQLQHTRLLQSRDKWTSVEALEFARVLEEEVRVRSELESAKKELSKKENEQLEVMQKYMGDLRRRYHEEQLWQDRWRIYSTFGTWGLIVLNTIVFMISQYMARLRENQRMREIQDSIRQSLLTNEGALRDIQEERQKNSDEKKGGQITKDEQDAMTQKLAQAIVKETSDSPIYEDGSLCSDIAPSEQPRNRSSILSSSRYWSTLRQFATNELSRIIRADRITNVDLPSAVLGASVTGIAWLIVAVAMSGKGSDSQ